ncbi:hypothetical protein Acsp02_70610 [Actinoplanes sp. NBRC 103695]|nr:hypothetical protein Acsp02_70610 [Actinoplanes sp. NBRC 103695]
MRNCRTRAPHERAHEGEARRAAAPFAAWELDRTVGQVGLADTGDSLGDQRPGRASAMFREGPHAEGSWAQSGYAPAAVRRFVTKLKRTLDPWPTRV